MKRFAPSPSTRGARLAPFAAAIVAAALIALTAMLAACSNPEPSANRAPNVISHSAALDADNGQIVFISVSLSAPARAAVEYENEFAGKFRTALSETAAAEHVIPVVRLRTDAVYQYAVGVEGGDGGELSYQARGEFTTGALTGILATMRSETRGRSSQDLIIADYGTEFSSERLEQRIVIMDALGYPVWNYAGAGANPTRKINAILALPNGNIAYHLWECCVIEITPLGEIVNEIAADRPHHDVALTRDGRTLYITARDVPFDDSANGGDSERMVRVDAVRELDPDGGETGRGWDPLDFWDMRDRAQWGVRNPNRGDWLHANSVEESPGGGYIVSLRNIYQAVSISPDFQTVRWRLGGPDSDFDFPNPADRFTMQHTASELPNGNILVFDNRAALPPEEGEGNYSRALELRLDFESMTAVKAWEFSPEPRMHSRINGSAYRLDNGNTLINFGVSDDPATIPIAIMGADAEGREVFRLETIDPPAAASATKAPYRYRAYPGPKSIMGETMLRAPKRR